MMRVKVWALTLVLLASAGAMADEPPVSFAALEELRQQAMVDANAAELERLLDAGCTYTHSTGLAQTRSELIAMLTGDSVDYLSIDTADVRTVEYPGAAVVTGRQTIELRVKGEPVTSVSRYTVVWAQTEDGGWKCAAYQSTTIPEGGD